MFSPKCLLYLSSNSSQGLCFLRKSSYVCNILVVELDKVDANTSIIGVKTKREVLVSCGQTSRCLPVTEAELGIMSRRLGALDEPLMTAVEKRLLALLTRLCPWNSPLILK